MGARVSVGRNDPMDGASCFGESAWVGLTLNGRILV